MTPPAVGVTLAGKYAIGRRIGAGGYGAVYEGENLALGKKVAIKLIDRRHERSEEAIGRFRREARAGAMIESPNIAQVFDVGEDAERGLYMVMELLRGDDLRHKLDRVARLDVDFAVQVGHQVASALAKAHAAGVVHRDLKPANIFLHEPSAEAGDAPDRVVVKIVDFGVAKLMDEAPGTGGALSKPLTVAGRTVGTPQYMSPEQVQGLPYDHRADLWALGAVLYESLAGRPAFDLKESFQDTALAIVLEEPRPLRELSPDTPPEVAAVVERALRKDASERFADATEFAEALAEARPRAILDRASAVMPAARPPRSPRPPPMASPTQAFEPPLSTASGEVAVSSPPAARRRVGAVVVVGVLAGAAAVLVLAALRTTSGPRPTTSAPSTRTSATTAPGSREGASSHVAATSAVVSSAVGSSAVGAVVASPSTSALPSLSASASVTPRAWPSGKPSLPKLVGSASAQPEGATFGGAGVSSSF